MNSTSLTAFRDELEKIAIWGGFKNLVHEGWAGTKDAKNTWMGAGKITKYLPIGGKSLMTLGVAPMVGSALSHQDPEGQERSRAERVMGLGGNLAGGLAGSALGVRALGKLPGGTLIGGIGGTIAGSMLGEKVTSAPLGMARQHRQAYLAARAQPQPAPVEGVPA